MKLCEDCVGEDPIHPHNKVTGLCGYSPLGCECPERRCEARDGMDRRCTDMAGELHPQVVAAGGYPGLSHHTPASWWVTPIQAMIIT